MRTTASIKMNFEKLLLLIFAQSTSNMNKQSTSTLIIAVLLIVIAALSRVILYPYNFSPIIGMAIFAGAVIKDKRLAFALPLFAMFLSDVIFEAGYSIGSSLLFFFLSNSAFFVFDNPIYHTYTQDFNGYVATLAGGLPFLKTGIVADLVYSTVLFGTYFLVQHFAFSKKAVA